MNSKKRCFTYIGLVIITLFLSACGPKDPFPFIEPGGYQFGTKINIKFTDASRDDQEISLYIWYPATLPADDEPSKYNFDAEPDTSGAPYPVILISAKAGNYFGPHLATHGFNVVGVDRQDSEDHYGSWLIDFPLEQIAALNHVGTNSPEGLVGMNLLYISRRILSPNFLIVCEYFSRLEETWV